jgi:hypothetical protein
LVERWIRRQRNYERYGMVADSDRAAERWGWVVSRTERPEVAYRGMVIPDLRAFRKILRGGLEPRLGLMGKLYVSFDAGAAMKFAFRPNHSPHLEPAYRVLFEFDAERLDLREDPGVGQFYTRDLIRRPSIRRIFVLRKDGATRFPFTAFDPDVLLESLKPTR